MKLIKSVGLCIVFVLFSQIALASTALDWLSSQTHSDGSISQVSDIATDYQATTETLRAFHAIDEFPAAGISEPLAFVNNEAYQGTEYLARRIIVNSEAGRARLGGSWPRRANQPESRSAARNASIT